MKILDVDLVLFEDDATGDYGVTHKETCLNDYGFNAFWNGIGIFHDVFEHWFEFNHKYFMGDYAMNICGEMVAMGASMYYYEMIGNTRKLSKYHPFSESMKYTTFSEIQEAIQNGYHSFGDRLLTKIPYQRPVYNSELEYQIQKYYEEAKELKYKDDPNCESSKEFSKQFRESITFQNIANPHRYGYRLAQRMIPDTHNNCNELYCFIRDFDSYCKANPAEELYNMGYSGLKVKVFKEKQEIRYKVYLKNIEGKLERILEQ